MSGRAVQDLEGLRCLVAQWADVWGLPGLERRVEITFSSRFRSTLGLYFPSTGEIRLAAFLLTGPPALLRETLCHEAAHAALYELRGRVPKPHGFEWRVLMLAVGFEPRARFPDSLPPAAPAAAEKHDLCQQKERPCD